MIYFAFAAIVSLALAAPPGAYLSIFGSDANDGLSQMNAVKTLLRAYQVMKAQQYAIIFVQPGSYPLASITVDGALALVGTQNNPSLTKFSCQAGQASLQTVSNNHANISFDSIQFEGCAQVVQIGMLSTASTYYNYNLFVYNTQFTGNGKDIVVTSGNVRVYITSSRFESGTQYALSTYQYSNHAYAGCVITIENSKFVNYNNGVASAIDMTLASFNSLSVNLTGVSFTASNSGGSFLNLGGTYSTLLMNQVSMTGGTTGSCTINLQQGCTATITKAQFTNKVGGPCLCVSGASTATLQYSDFVNNTVSSKSFSGAAGAVWIGGGSTFAVANSNFRQNSLDIGEGGGVHCAGSHLTVAQSVFSYNTAPDAPAASCNNCVLVAYGNQQYSNTGSATDACAL